MFQTDFTVCVVRVTAALGGGANIRQPLSLLSLPLLSQPPPPPVSVEHGLARDQRVPKARMRVAQHEDVVARVEERRQQPTHTAHVEKKDGGFGQLTRPSSFVSAVNLVDLQRRKSINVQNAFPERSSDIGMSTLEMHNSFTPTILIFRH